MKQQYKTKLDIQGITLIALVVTIIILLILAGVVLNLTIGKNGIINRTQESAIQHIKAEIKQEIELAILEIELDSKSNDSNKNLDSNTIFQNLSSKLSNIIIKEDMSGEYRDYEYWIDEEYKVHVGEKTNHPIKIHLSVSYVGTSSCMLNVVASSTKGNIVDYQYVINNSQFESLSQSNYKIENLEPNTKYSILVKVIDEKGNTKTSAPITIVTEARTYLYNNGDECANITGGWNGFVFCHPSYYPWRYWSRIFYQRK